jgi:hypothetical protein
LMTRLFLCHDISSTIIRYDRAWIKVITMNKNDLLRGSAFKSMEMSVDRQK